MGIRIVRIASLPALLLFFSAEAWPARGDIDPNYGEGGQLVTIQPSVLLALPGDWLAVGQGTDGSGDGFRIRMIDATGRRVPTFGQNGVALIDSSAAARTFWPEAAALAPNGDMIFMGASSDTLARELLRVDSSGQPVVSFGIHGDGSLEPALTAARANAFAVDPDGRILLAQGIWDADGNCGTAAQLQRLLANGQPDSGFGNSGTIEVPDLDVCNGAPVFAARSDGSIIVGDGRAIVAVSAAGAIDATFGVGGRLAVSGFASAQVLLLPDGGLLIVGARDVASPPYDALFLKYDRNGQPDLSFGLGTGSVAVDLGAEFLGMSSVNTSVDQVVLDPDGIHLATHVSVTRTDGSLVCSGIARLEIDGTADTSSGRNGLTCLNIDFNLTAVQSNGAPIFYAGYDAAIHRLLPDDRPSPGFLRVVTAIVSVKESDGTAAVVIERLAGRDGAIHVDYATVDRRRLASCYYSRCLTPAALAGSDYVATSGRLDWASGDGSQRTVTVAILDDSAYDGTLPETFGVDFTDPSGGALLLAANPTIYIQDNDQPTAPASSTPPPPPPANSGGGGSFTWVALFALTAQLFMRRQGGSIRSTNPVVPVNVPLPFTSR